MLNRLWARVVFFSLIPITGYCVSVILFPLYFLLGPLLEPLSFYDCDQFGGYTTFHDTHQGWL